MAASFEKAISDELRYWPGASVKFEHGAKHPRAVLSFNHHIRSSVFPGSSGDIRAVKNQVSQIRGLLKQLGAERRKTLPTSKRELQEEAAAMETRNMVRLAITPSVVTLTIPRTSPIYSRFADRNNQAVGYWSIEMRSNPDLKSDPFIAVVQKAAPPKGTRHPGVIGGSFNKINQSFILAVQPHLIPNVAKHGPFGASPVELYEENDFSILFRMPKEKKAVLVRGKPKLVEEPVVVEPKLELPAELPVKHERKTERAEPRDIVLKPVTVPLNIERAIQYLNKRKHELGNNLRFTINEGGRLSAVHRIE